MLFFRSEDQIDAWCRERKLPRRPLVTREQLWKLAVAWYENRLRPDARRPAPAEMRDIFEKIGLEGPFWDPEADSFR
jgi:hypothetical protein